jgi:cytochrome c-type biogenesis protein CcmE
MMVAAAVVAVVVVVVLMVVVAALAAVVLMVVAAAIQLYYYLKKINKFGELSLNGSDDEQIRVADLIKTSKAKLVAIETFNEVMYSDQPIESKLPFTVKRLVTPNGIINLKTESDKIKRYSSL